METFASFSIRWQETILPLKKRASQCTMKSHIRLLNARLGSCPLLEINYKSIQALFSELAVQQQPRSVKNIFGTFRNLMGQAVREKLIEKFPTPVLPKVKRTQQDWLTHAQMRAIITACTNDYKPFVCLMCETGLRIGEALGLQTQDIDFNERTLSVNRSVYGGNPQEPKTSTAYRTFAISPRLSNLLSGQCDIRSKDAYIFRTRAGTPQWPSEIRSRYLDPLLRLQGIEPVGYHSFRRGNATFFASVIGMPERILAHRLGHACKSMTLGTYAMNVDKSDVPYVIEAEKLLYT